MIEWFFTPIWILWLLMAMAAMVNAIGFLRWSRNRDMVWSPGLDLERQKPVALVIAIKGFDPENTPRFLAAIRSQKYRRYRLLLSMESADDPVAPWLREQLGLRPDETRWESDAEEGLTEIRLVYAGQCEGRGQKIHNQIAAFDLLDEQDAIIAFADADMHCDADWLARLVAPINVGTHRVSSTYRYLVPRRSDFVNAIATAINGSVATAGGHETWNNLWGGSMAMAREDFDELDVPELFSGSLNDDLRLGTAVRSSGRRVAFVKSLLRPSPVNFNWPSLFEFGRRQYVQVRVFAPVFYLVALISTWTYVLGFITAVVALVGWGSLVAVTVLLAVFFCDVIRALSRQRILRHLFDAEILDGLRGLLWVELFLTPFWMAVHAVLATSALFTNRIQWAGIDYRILGPDRTEVLGRADGD